MRIKTHNEALRLARCAGEDAANRRMRKAGRKIWSDADHEHAIAVTERILVGLGFDVVGWRCTAGVPRNAPPEPKATRKPRRRSSAEPVQLSLAFG